MDLSQRAGTRSTLESRALPFDGAELREDSGGTSLTFTGYASVFNRSYAVSDWLGEFNEQVAPGTFRDTLAQGADVPFKLNHEGMTLARTKSGTMTLAEDTHGLHVEARLDPANPQVQALRSAMQRGDIDEMSFAFRVTDDQWSPDYMHRTITGADINKGDVSAVNYGANPFTAGASLRSAELQRFANAIRGAGTEVDPEALAALRSALADPTIPAEQAQSKLPLFALRLRALSL